MAIATKKEEEIIMKIYRAIYDEIGVDIDTLISDGTTKKEMWFLNYYLPIERQEEIILTILKTEKLSKWKKASIRMTILLGSAPKG